jgi:hypothetical protein
VEEIPWPTLALIGGLLGGFVLGVVFQGLARLGARRRRRRAEQRLREAIRRVAEENVLSAIEEEFSKYKRFCTLLDELHGRSP